MIYICFMLSLTYKPNTCTYLNEHIQALLNKTKGKQSV